MLEESEDGGETLGSGGEERTCAGDGDADKEGCGGTRERGEEGGEKVDGGELRDDGEGERVGSLEGCGKVEDLLLGDEDDVGVARVNKRLLRLRVKEDDGGAWTVGGEGLGHLAIKRDADVDGLSGRLKETVCNGDGLGLCGRSGESLDDLVIDGPRVPDDAVLCDGRARHQGHEVSDRVLDDVVAVDTRLEGLGEKVCCLLFFFFFFFCWSGEVDEDEVDEDGGMEE